MHRYVLGFIAFNFVLGFGWASVVGVALPIKIPCMNLNNFTRYMPGFGVPGYMVAYFKFSFHSF